MPLVINTNVPSLTAQRNLNINTNNLNKSLERLSTGFRINRAADDAAGIQIAARLDAQRRGIQKAIENTQDGINIIGIAESAYDEVQENLQRIRELTVQAANDTNSSADRTSIENEVQARIDEISRIANVTEYNDQKLTDGSLSSFKIQVGQNDSDTEDVIDIGNGFADITATTLGVGTLDLSDNSAALTFLGTVDNALDELTSTRATLGQFQNRLESAATNLSAALGNFGAALSRIRDVDVAKEAAELTRYQILQQTSAALLAQANQAPSLALSLVR